MQDRPGTQRLLVALLAVAASLLAVLLFAGLAHPLLWHDEADTAVLGERVLLHGVPQVRGEPALLSDLDPERVDPETGVYRGGVWGSYYLAALGIALARGSEDFHARTAWLRLPFAALGLAGLCLVGLGLLPAAGEGRALRLFFLTGFALANATSISLLLHLRQVRWYAPAVFLVGAVVALYARRCLGRLGFGVWCAGSALGLAALFHVFPPAFGALGLALVLGLARRALRDDAPWPPRLRALLREAAGPALGLALVLPAIFGFALSELLGEWTRTRSSAGRSFTENLAWVIPNLLRFELLAPALFARLGVHAALALRGDTPLPDPLRRRLDVAGFLLGFAALYALVICAKPLLWERYFTPLSPLLAAACLLDACALWDLAREASLAPRARRAARTALALLALALAGALWLRAPLVAGRIAEIRHPVAGPLDAIVPYLAERHADPSRLVIATNYEGAAYSLYLRSRVIVGFYGGNLEEDMRLVPDVIVPRPWPRHIGELQELAARADYRPVHLPVRSARTNGTPSLWPGSLGGVHAFHDVAPRTDAERTFLLERADLVD